MGVYSDYLVPFTHWLMFTLPPGPAVIPLCYVINFAKAGTLPFCFACMQYFNNWSATAYLISALHGSYGMLWFVKHFVLPDAYWDNKATLSSCLLVVLPVLMMYWSAAYLTISRGIELPPHQMFVAIMLYVSGVTLMLCSDTQKYFVLRAKKGLIADGWFAFCRNTNYLGEMLLYSSFAFISHHPFPICFDLLIWLTVFGARWAEKEASFLRKKGGEAYIAGSSYIIPTQVWVMPIYLAFMYYMRNYYALP